MEGIFIFYNLYNFVVHKMLVSVKIRQAGCSHWFHLQPESFALLPNGKSTGGTMDDLPHAFVMHS